mmetsp:Transcript_13185/g.17377  ORF Transcript_13185/g.17377 Transcript_13185/m.17377 type:complete len:288 (+) Transcript_13185:1882-2745(+)
MLYSVKVLVAARDGVVEAESGGGGDNDAELLVARPDHARLKDRVHRLEEGLGRALLHPLVVHEDGATFATRHLLVFGAEGRVTLVLGDGAVLEHTVLERQTRDLADAPLLGELPTLEVRNGRRVWHDDGGFRAATVANRAETVGVELDVLALGDEGVACQFIVSLGRQAILPDLKVSLLLVLALLLIEIPVHEIRGAVTKRSLDLLVRHDLPEGGLCTIGPRPGGGGAVLDDTAEDRHEGRRLDVVLLGDLRSGIIRRPHIEHKLVLAGAHRLGDGAVAQHVVLHRL